ncbi:MAG TPA: hypothetical protein VEK34_08885 [Methylocella sp.]|nr:hypothetical protein [Methylocella sp.]
MRKSKNIAKWTTPLLLGAALATSVTPALAHSWRGAYRWHAGYWRPGWGYAGWGVPVATEVGLIYGPLAGAPYPYGPVYYNGCYWQQRPVFDSWGNYAGSVPVWACQ